MYVEIRTAAKKILSKLLPDSTRLRFLSYLPKLESFRKAHLETYPVFEDRYSMYHYINETILENRPIIYCEFGVFEGASIKKWSSLNSDTNSLFYGFDTFTGLPETWITFTENVEKNTFDVKGQYPKVDDERILFKKGMFQHTLPEFIDSYNGNNQLVIHNDSDLYSSTLYVLTAAHKLLVPGTILIFDEFSSILNEFRALEDYCSSYLRSYEVLAVTASTRGYYSQVAIRMI